MQTESGYFKHEKAVVETDSIGKGTRIWMNAHIMKDVVIGEHCNIGEGCFIESGVKIGNNVVIKNNIAIWDGVVIEDSVFLGPNMVFTNELEPRSGFPKEVAKTFIRKGASIGANATIVANHEIGEHAMIGAGSVVTKNIPANRLAYGNPAQLRGWVCTCGRKLQFENNKAKCICNRSFELGRENIIEK